MTARAIKSLNGRHVLVLVVGFFATVMAVNAVMVWLALGSFPGLVSANAYREGLAYNRTIEAREAQRVLGWQVTVDAAERGNPRRIEARFLDRGGAPLRELDVTARMVRPVVRGADRTIVLREVAPGIYRADDTVPSVGHWRLEIDARKDDRAWHMERELWLK
jgi:nitrogen fixation protein FixH